MRLRNGAAPGEPDLEAPKRIDVGLNSLVSEARSGAEGAFEKLARRVHPQIHRWALARTGDVQDANDVAQEALVRMYRSLPGYDGRAAFSSWLYQVTRSAAASEGKTSIAVQLDASIARATDEPTLLIDADLRSPDLHTILEVSASPGLAEVLAGECPIEEAIIPCNSCLSLLPSGILKSSPRRLLVEGRLPRLLDSLRGEFKNIVIDAPPILPASESLLIAKAADTCLLCAMRDTSSVE